MGRNPRVSVAVRAQRGVALLEVLITAVILAVGLMGMAALQLRAVQFNHAAYLRSQAYVLAYDMADRLRLNRGVAMDGGYDIDYGAEGSGSGLVGDDLSEWKGLLADYLPGGDGTVNCNADGLCTISVRWHESAERDAASEADWPEFSYQTRI